MCIYYITEFSFVIKEYYLRYLFTGYVILNPVLFLSDRLNSL